MTGRSAPLLVFVTACLCVGLVSCATKCYKNEELGDLDENVYHCYGEEKPECCTENEEFTCCEATSTKTWREQLQLWGTVAAIIALMLLVCVCFKSDFNMCNGSNGENDNRTFLERIGLRKKPEPQLSDLSQGNEKDTSLSTPTAAFSGNQGYSRLPPLSSLPPLPGERTPRGYRGRYNDGYDDYGDHYYR